MTYANTFGALSSLMMLSSRANYFTTIFRGKTKPHAFSWLIWGVISSIGFCAQVSQGAGAGSWSRGLGSFTSFLIFIIALRKGHIHIKRSDWVTLALAFCAIPLWIATKTPVWSVVLVCIIDLLGCYPTLRKSWGSPFEETVRSYTLSAVGGFFSIIAIEHYTVSTWLYPVESLCANILIIICLLHRRKHARKLVAGAVHD